jgi:hypothetical protein
MRAEDDAKYRRSAARMHELLEERAYDISIKKKNGACFMEFKLLEANVSRTPEQRERDLAAFREFAVGLNRFAKSYPTSEGDVTLSQWFDLPPEEQQKVLEYVDSAVTRIDGRVDVIMNTIDTTPPRIELPPAYRIDHLLQFLVTKDTYRRVFSQTVIDMRIDYIAAIKVGNGRGASRALLQGYWSLIRDWFLMLPGSLIAAVAKRLSGQ